MLEDLIESAGVDFRQTSEKGEIVLCCPFCEERDFPPDTKYHLGLNVLNGLAHCFRCSFASRDPSWTHRELCRVYGIELRFRAVRQKPKKKEKPVTVEPEDPKFQMPEEYEQFGAGKDELERNAYRYLTARGVTRLQIYRHKIGFAACGKMAWRVLFPVLDPKGRPLQCVGRALGADVNPKYLNAEGTRYLWGTHRTGDSAVFVEGIFDALAVERVMLGKPGWSVIARLGASLSEIQLAQLKPYKQIVILPDADRPGIKGATQVAAMCADAGLKVWMGVPEALDGVDPGAMFEDQLQRFVTSARPWSKEVEWRLRVLK